MEHHIKQRYSSDNDLSNACRTEILRVCTEFIDSDLADKNFVQELTSGEDSRFWARVSEALLFDQLNSHQFNVCSKEVGPDFLVKDQDQKVWIEVICPEPKGIPDAWLDFKEGVVAFPGNDILLRWTAAIKEKAEKLVGKNDNLGYLKQGHVSEDDAYVIAINGCQLRNGLFPSFTGVSGFPFAVEAVFPIGAFQLQINSNNKQVVESGHQYRSSVLTNNHATVETNIFLNPQFQSVSALWAVDINGDGVIGNPEPTAIIHNPIAKNPIRQGLLPANCEYVATLNNYGELERIVRK